ncbi:MAG TPA: ABC transporter substrate-binding protein [Roseomonas sp.]|jgi:putative spermidine/putrescine transport system substrate-binding protein
MNDPAFQQDCAAILAMKAAQEGPGRRGLLRGLAGLGAAGLSLGAAGMATAQAREVVLADWGGDGSAAFRKAFGEPFQRSTGLRFGQDGSGPSPGRIRSMVQSGKVIWDVMDTAVGAGHFLGADGLLEEIDWSIVDRSLDMPGLGHRYAAGAYTFSVVLAWDTRAFGGRSPTGWADFWNLRDFPGPRMLRRDPQGVLEAALMADGVPPDQLYPLDVERAFRKVREIRPRAVFWGSGSDSQQIMRQGDAVMGLLWNTRAMLLQRDTQDRIRFTWNQGILQPSVWTVPKGNPAGKDAMRLIRSMQEPAGQVELLRLLGNGPVNPAAAAMVPPELKPLNPTDPENARVQIPYGVDWYVKNYQDVLARYVDMVTG